MFIPEVKETWLEQEYLCIQNLPRGTWSTLSVALTVCRCREIIFGVL
jgi:hypothetical protein